MYDLFNGDIYKKSIEELKNSNLVHEEIEFLNPTEAFLRQIELQQEALDCLEEEEDLLDEEDLLAEEQNEYFYV